jgi:haloacetate dehalogenase
VQPIPYGAALKMFDGFKEHRLKTRDAEVFFLTAGDGPPLLLLHGYPQTHVAWHAVAPLLVSNFSLVVPDLRGYGESKGPPPDPEHHGYSKRAMAEDMLEIMNALGYERFMMAGHDRGGRVAYRLALDHPDCVSKLAAIDIIPTLNVWEMMDKDAALGTYHWMFLAQPSPIPERLIGHDPDFYLHHLLESWAGRKNVQDPSAVDEYLRHFRKPSVIEATCEDYRAGATIDFEHDRLDRESGRRIQCPVLVLWGKRYLASKATSSPADVWRSWANEVKEVTLDCGHFVLEEKPEACAEVLLEFFGS